MFRVALAAAAATVLTVASPALAQAQTPTSLDATFTGPATESLPTPVNGQVITLHADFLTYAASPNLPQITGGDLGNYSFNVSATAIGYDDATRTATYTATGNIMGYGQIVQTFAPTTLTIAFDPNFLTAVINSSLTSTGPTDPFGRGVVDFTPANGALVTGTYQSNGVFGGGGTVNGAISFLSAVPEPATWSMMILGIGAVGFTMRRRQRVRTTVTFA